MKCLQICKQVCHFEIIENCETRLTKPIGCFNCANLLVSGDKTLYRLRSKVFLLKIHNFCKHLLLCRKGLATYYHTHFFQFCEAICCKMGQEKIDALIDKKRREQTPFYQNFQVSYVLLLLSLHFNPSCIKRVCCACCTYHRGWSKESFTLKTMRLSGDQRPSHSGAPTVDQDSSFQVH